MGNTKAGEVLLKADHAAILTDRATADFMERFAPTAPRRRSEFKAELAVLIDGHCLARERNVIDKAEKVTAKTLGSKGGEKGGPARARSLSREQRVESAKNAINARWHGERARQAEAMELIKSVRAKRGTPPSRRAIAKHFNCSPTTAARYLKAAEGANGL